MKRPLWTLGLVYALFLGTAFTIGYNPSIVLAVLFFVFFVCSLLIARLRANAVCCAVLFCGTAAFTAYACVQGLAVRPAKALDGMIVHIQAQIVSTPASGSIAYRAQTVSGDLEAGTRLVLYIPPAQAVAAYEQVEMDVQLKELTDGKDLYAADGIFLSGYTVNWDEESMRVTEAPFSVSGWLYGIKTAAAGQVQKYLPGDIGNLVVGICLGQKGWLSAAATENFRGAGLTHLLVVSGLHVTIMSAAVLMALQALRVPRRLAALIAALGVVFFMLLVGLSPSVLRAGVMCLIVIGGMLCKREADSRNSLGFALWLLLLFNPYSLFDLGLLLSFGATAGILLIAPWLQRQVRTRLCRHRLPDWRPPRPVTALCNAICITLGAILPLLPITACAFGEISLIAPLSNLLGVFPSTVLMLTGCAAMLLSAVPFLGWLVQGTLLAAGLLARYLLALTAVLGNTFLSNLSMRQSYLLCWLPAALAFVWMSYRLLRMPGVRRAAALSVLILLCGMFSRFLFLRGVTTLTVMDTESAGVFLLAQDGQNGLIIQGKTATALRLAQAALKRRGIRQLDFLLLAQPGKVNLADFHALLTYTQVQCLLYPREEVSLSLANTAEIPEKHGYGAGDVYPFWNTHHMEFAQGGWIRLLVGQTRVLCCPPAGCVKELSADWRRSNLLLFVGALPQDASVLIAQQAAMSCTEEQVLSAVQSLPWSTYPIALTPLEGDVEWMTRGKGDVTGKGGFH